MYVQGMQVSNHTSCIGLQYFLLFSQAVLDCRCVVILYTLLSVTYRVHKYIYKVDSRGGW